MYIVSCETLINDIRDIYTPKEVVFAPKVIFDENGPNWEFYKRIFGI
jgi:hypothetical protein